MTKKLTLRKIELAGELGISAAAAVREQLLAALGDHATEIEVDLARVTEIDSAGVQLMVAAKQEAAARGKTLHFSAHSAAVVEVLDLLDLIAHFGDPVLLPGARQGDSA